MKAKSKKLNNSCIKIFKFLSLLYEDKADYKDVTEIFKGDVDEKSDNNIQVVLNKYMNALRVFGIKIAKKNHKFELESSLYSLPLSDEDIKSLSIFWQSCKKFPVGKVSENLRAFLKNIETRMQNEDKLKLSDFKNEKDLSFYYSSLKDQVEFCEKVCADEFMVDITYQKNKKVISGSYIPLEVVYDSKTPCLIAGEKGKEKKYTIPLTNILSIEHSHQKIPIKDIQNSVVYKVRGRLAKTYRLKENEQSEGMDKNGEQTIISRNTSYDTLLPRLMRYSDCCEIITPKFLREEMYNLINETLANYDEK